MAIISSFLCWSNTRTGSAVCGYYTLVISVLCLAFYMLRYIALDKMDDSLELKGIVYAGFVLYSFLIGVSLILLPGVYMDRKFLLLPWIYVLVITVLYETGAIALVTTVHLGKENTLDVWEIVAVAFYCLRLIANCYCFACVVSQYQELSEGRGTYEFLFKPRRRHQARDAPLSDIDEYNPPYGAALPPYSLENPFKQFSPPTYDNLGLDFEDLPSVRSVARHGLLRSYLADVIVNRVPPDCIDVCSITSLDNSTCRVCCCEDCSSDYQSDLSEDVESPLDCEESARLDRRTIDNEESANHLSPENCITPQQFHHHRHYRKYCTVSPDSQSDSVAMTTASANVLGSNSSGSTPRCHRSCKSSPASARGRHRDQRVKGLNPAKLKQDRLSPLTIQKRTYITWI